MLSTLKRAAKSTLRVVLIAVLRNTTTRTMLNTQYNKLGYKAKSKFHGIFSKTFRGKDVKFKGAMWKIEFNNKVINIPLEQDDMWLDWDEAVSILGHDIKIKQTYQDLIERKLVKCFLDVGANYGTHSLLFLSQGIETFTFEPNPFCVTGFRRMLVANKFGAKIVPHAVGDHNYETVLHFPEKDTWLGTLSDTVKGDLETKEYALTTVKTDVITLDSYVIGRNMHPDLIKIDTEGFELSVLNGATRTIRKYKPMIIFEENEGIMVRREINNFFDKVGYSIYSLPYTETVKTAVSRRQFLTSKETNFIAVSNL